MNKKTPRFVYPPMRTDRALALFLLGVVIFNPPILSIFGVVKIVLGWPILYLYIFVAWLVVIGLMALYCEASFQGQEDKKRQEDKKSQD